MAIPLKYNLRSLLQRRSRTILTVLGFAAVIAVFVAMVGFGRGMAASFDRTGSPDNVVVVQKGAFNQSLSLLPRMSRDVIQYLPHIRKKVGTALVSPEMSIEPWVTVAGRSEPVFMVARGVEPVFFDVADTLRLTDGSAELRGNRVLLGRGAQQKLGGLGVGDTIRMFGEPWKVSGAFEAGGTNLEFEVVADVDDLMRAAKRDEYSAFTVKLDDPANAVRLVGLLEKERRVLLSAAREKDFYAASGRTYAIVARLGLMIAFIVSIGAVFGGMNTMYTVVAGRTREVGVLRALGFSRRSILASFVVESLLLSLLGGVLGAAIGLLANGLRVSVMTANIRFSMGFGVAFAGILLAAVVGLLGGLLPARSAARMEVIDAMRRI